MHILQGVCKLMSTTVHTRVSVCVCVAFDAAGEPAPESVASFA